MIIMIVVYFSNGRKLAMRSRSSPDINLGDGHNRSRVCDGVDLLVLHFGIRHSTKTESEFLKTMSKLPSVSISTCKWELTYLTSDAIPALTRFLMSRTQFGLVPR